jgi:hypothetical protein
MLSTHRIIRRASRSRSLAPQSIIVVAAMVAGLLLPTALAKPSADRVQLLSAYMLQAAGILIARANRNSACSCSCADLVHDNLPLHPLPNHLADAAVAQLLIGGATGKCQCRLPSVGDSCRVSRIAGAQKANTILSWMLQQNIRFLRPPTPLNPSQPP